MRCPAVSVEQGGGPPRPDRVFFESTSSAAASASALSLRRSSRSNSLMRRWSCLVCCDVAHASPGAVRACVALWRQAASSCGYTPCSRHQAFLLASSMAAVVNTASKRAAAVHWRCCIGCDRASERQRSSVSTLTPISREITSTAELSGGNNRATARSLKAPG